MADEPFVNEFSHVKPGDTEYKDTEYKDRDSATSSYTKTWEWPTPQAGVYWCSS